MFDYIVQVKVSDSQMNLLIFYVMLFLGEKKRYLIFMRSAVRKGLSKKISYHILEIFGS